MHVQGYAALSAKQPVAPYTFTLAALAPGEVRVDVTHCGVCRSDVSYVDNHLGFTVFPLVAGHEIVGVVREVGANVTHLVVGQRVGIGPIRGACMNCSYCASGRENLCRSLQLTIAGATGGFAPVIQLNAAFAFPIPERLPSANTAPLLCAGLTVYSALRQHTTPASSIGVIGIGGLGQLALRFGAARGNEVSAFSTSPKKEELARRQGAHRFVVSRDASQMARAAGSLDFILSTIDAEVNWADYLNLLRPDGKICVVGASMHPIAVPTVSLIVGQRGFVGSAAGSRSAMQEMLAFAARHDITAEVEVLPASQLNAALESVRKGEAERRFVIEHG